MAPRTLPLALVVTLVVAFGPASAGAARPALVAPRPQPTLRIVLGGDVMLGRGVSLLASTDPAAVFGGARFELASADLTVANLESPLTSRRHDRARGPNALEARPGTARILERAGFDAMAIANNHAGDAGPDTVPDTIRALAATHVRTIGAGAATTTAYAPLVLASHGIRVAFLSFDDTGEGPHATVRRPGVAWWNARRVHAALARARAEADLVVVGLHGGSDYNPTTDPRLARLGRLLAAWGADVVWGTGPHVVQPTRVIAGAHGRSTIVATSLGNLLFDQSIPGTRTGELLELLAGKAGVRAYRLGATAEDASNAVRFEQWHTPRAHADAVAIDGEWWTLAGRVAAIGAAAPPNLRGFPVEHVVATATGDPVGDGSRQVAVSFWRPFRRTDVNAVTPRRLLVDRRGLTNHVGIYTPTGREIWVAGTVLQPVHRLAACDGSLAVAYSSLDASAVVAADAWIWRGFGFTPVPALSGAGTPACADVDGDGRLDPVILGRSSR